MALPDHIWDLFDLLVVPDLTCAPRARLKCDKASRDWTVTVVFDALQDARGSGVVAEVVGGVCRQSEVAIHQRHQ